MTPIVTCEDLFDYRGLSLGHITGLSPLGTLRDVELDLIAFG